MAEQDNIQIARSVTDAWNARDPERYAKLLAADYVQESDTLPAPARGPEGARQVMRTYLAAFPDLNLEIEHVFASGDVVTTRWRATGTQRGELMGIAPTNRRAEVRGCTVAEIRNGKIVQELVYWDTGHLLRQLGVLPERSMAAGR